SDSDSTATASLEKSGALPKVEVGESNAAAPADKRTEATVETAETRVEKGPKDVLADPAASHEDKLKAAHELAKEGTTSFEDEGGRKYYVSVADAGSRELVSIHTRGDDGRSHAVLRGVVDADGKLSRQRDAEGKEVPYVSKWAESNLKDSALVAGKETSDRPAEAGTEVAEKAPTAEDFLKKHPELKLSDADRARALTEYDKALDQYEKDKQRLDDAKEAARSLEKVTEDLKKDGVTEQEDPAKFQEQFNKLPEEKRREYEKRFAEIKPHAEDIAKLSELEARVKLDERRMRDAGAKLDFESDLKAIDKLPPDKRAEVYKSLDAILDKREKATGLTDKERLDISRDLVHNLAHPEDIKQGNKGTCALATTEYMLARERPEVYARSVAEWATRGELTTMGDGKVEPGKGVKIDPAEIHRDDGNPERGLASKIFQTGAANLALAESGGRYVNYKPGEAPAVNEGKAPTPVDDTGERVITSDGKVRDWTGLYAKDQVDVLNKLTGDKYVADKLYADTHEQLHAQLKEAADKHGYPIKVSFLDSDGGHVVSITGIDSSKSPPEVIYEDTAEPRGAPQKLPMNKFYERALKGGSIETVGGMKLRILAVGEGARPYVEIIHN
ncbi:MAG TPA: hypothetical protein V6D08_09780, partial [Candidatus Obscuribacterales bacterium]